MAEAADTRTIRMKCCCGATLWIRHFEYWSHVQPVVLAWIESHKHPDPAAVARRQALGLDTPGAP